MRRFINQNIKHREWFRPLAPTILAEDTADWFEGISGNASPFMSLTAKVKEMRRGEIPAVCHVDGSARLQTLSKADNPLYHKLISAFKAKTGCPIILNTSFNDKVEGVLPNYASVSR